MLIIIINNLFDLTNGSFKNLINTNLQGYNGWRMGGVVNHLYKYYGYHAFGSLVSGIADGTISLIGELI